MFNELERASVARMALDIRGPTRHATIADDGEHIVSTLPGRLAVKAPVCDRIWDRFYASPYLDAVGVTMWRAERVALHEAWTRERRSDLVRDRKIRATEPGVLDQILARMLEADRTRVVLDELIAVCDDAINARDGLRFISD